MSLLVENTIIEEQAVTRHLKDFEFKRFLGEGSYGKVFHIVEKDSSNDYAIKIMTKKAVLKKNDSEYIREERNILTEVKHPFIVSLYYAFQTDTKLYLVMDLALGGELFQFLTSEGLFLEKNAAFYLAEIILAIEYLHKLDIVHRDLKPENVLLDENGHVLLTDFGLATRSVRTSTICGTDLYMAPEMVLGQTYGKAVDLWSLGALAFEMMTGDPPFYHKNTKMLYKKISTSALKLPSFLSKQASNLLKGLMTKDCTKRLGNSPSNMFKIGGMRGVKDHEFFINSNIDFKAIFNKTHPPPYGLKSLKNKKKLEKEEKKSMNLIKQENIKSKTTDEYSHSNFINFTFDVNKVMNANDKVSNSGEEDDISINIIEDDHGIDIEESEDYENFIELAKEEDITERMSLFKLR